MAVALAGATDGTRGDGSGGESGDDEGGKHARGHEDDRGRDGAVVVGTPV